LRRKGILSTHGIVQNSMRKDGFNLLSYPKKEGEMFQHIPVLELIEKQRAEAARILSEVVEDLREQERAYREKFREIKLRATFDGVSYAFEKIFEEVRPGSALIMGTWGVGHLQKVLDDFEKLLKDRGLAIDMYDSIEYLYDEIKHPLAELTKYIKKEPSEVLSNKSAVVFTDALQGHFDRLRDIAGELDEDYASAPDPVVQPVRPDVHVILTTTVIGEKDSNEK
jgi:Zn-dependent M32 family carboxypeptidase